MSLSFVILCGKCFRVVQANSSGSVLSCGDILCSTCNNIPFGSCSTCPACGKEGVKSLNLNEKLPEEVSRNLSDPSKELESIHEVLVFQVKYYKQIMKRLLLKTNRAEQECENYRRIIMDLENKLQSANSTSFLSVHAPVAPAGMLYEAEQRLVSQSSNPQQVVWNTGSSNKRQSQVLIEDQHNQRPVSSASTYRMATPMVMRNDDQPRETVMSLLGKRNSDEQIYHPSQQQQQQPQQPQYAGSSPRMVSMNSPQQQQPHAGSYYLSAQQQTQQGQQQHDSSPTSVHTSPQHRGFAPPYGADAQHRNSNNITSRPINTPSSRGLPPSYPYSNQNRPPSATMGRKIQSPAGIGGGMPTGARLRSPHVPVVRSPLLLSPNKGVNISQSEHQIAQHSQMQHYANSTNTNHQQQPQQQPYDSPQQLQRQNNGASLREFIGES